jgi:pyruvate,orthophosphate dikinase
MLAAEAVVTEEGGSTSHAAVVSRALGLPCVVGCGRGSLSSLIDDVVTVDGGSGAVYAGELHVDQPREDESSGLRTLIAWARERAPLEVTATSEGLDPKDVLDLSTVPDGNDPDRVADVIHQTDRRVLAGGAVAAPEAIGAALATGVTRVITSPVLPVLLTALRLASDSRPATSPMPALTTEGSAR